MFSTDPSTLDWFLVENTTVDFIHAVWIDFTGLPRQRILTRAFALEFAANNARQGAPPVLGLGASALSMIQDARLNGSENYTHTGQFPLIADWSSLRICGQDRRHALVMVSMGQESLSGEIASIDPRGCLSNILGTTNMLFGVEIEFLMVDSASKEPIASDFKHTWASTRALTGRPLTIMCDVVDAIAASGIEVQHFEAEGGPGQYEIATAPLKGIEAIDALYHARETIFAVCERHLTRSVFHPKPAAGMSGTGAHVHFSFPQDVAQDTENAFIAGVLTHLRAICAFTLPTIASYDRLGDGAWSGGTWVAWGTQNRETPLRKIHDRHWEFKLIDATANAYLAVAAIVAAGHHGVMEKMCLGWGDCVDDPGTLAADKREQLGIISRLPLTLAESLQAITDDDYLCNELGEDLVHEYILVKRTEVSVVEKEGKEWYRQWY